MNCYINLKTILQESGFEIVNSGAKAEIDLTELSKDTLINLLT
jgi:hypothetical protein